MKRAVQILFTAILLLGAASAGYSENIRGKVVGAVSSAEENTSRFRLEELVSIVLDDTDDSGNGAVELEIVIPPGIRRYRDSFSLYLYRQISPVPSADHISYYGEKIVSTVVPSLSKYYIQIPLKPEWESSPPQGTLALEDAVDPARFPLLLTILPVMKGIPGSVYATEFEITAKVLHLPMGSVEIALTESGTGEPVDPQFVSITIDDEPVDFPQQSYDLTPGIHTVSVVSSRYKDSHTRVVVEKGKTADVEIELENAYASFLLEAPDSALLFIDGNRSEVPRGSSQKITPGEHTFTIKLDDYSMSKKMEFTEGKTYNISLFFDIFIQEN